MWNPFCENYVMFKVYLKYNKKHRLFALTVIFSWFCQLGECKNDNPYLPLYYVKRSRCHCLRSDLHCPSPRLLVFITFWIIISHPPFHYYLKFFFNISSVYICWQISLFLIPSGCEILRWSSDCIHLIVSNMVL